MTGPGEASGEAKAGSQHLRDVEELRFDFVGYWIT